MAAVIKLKAGMAIIGPYRGSTLDLLHSLSAEAWGGPFNAVIPNGTAVQSLIILGIQGLSQITSMLITADQQVTIFYNTSVQGLLINPGGFHVFSDTSITAVAVTNVSGVEANVEYLCAGVAG
jgi:hypothetical protein